MNDYYVYIEAFENYLTLTYYKNSKVIYEDTYYSWNEIINAKWFEKDISVHISPDLFSKAGRDNTEWQAQNLYREN